MRNVTVDIEKVLHHVILLTHYGYKAPTHFSLLADITGYVSDEEISEFLNTFNSKKYDDYITTMITKWRDEYCKKEEICTLST